jgi:hypothetical protein
MEEFILQVTHEMLAFLRSKALKQKCLDEASFNL